MIGLIETKVAEEILKASQKLQEKWDGSDDGGLRCRE
jgi:hypothetical protein